MKRIRPEDAELKPCPFCGGEARLQFGFPRQQRQGVRVAFVQCHKCRAKTETVKQLPFMAWQDCKRYAIEKWNRREGDTNG